MTISIRLGVSIPEFRPYSQRFRSATSNMPVSDTKDGCATQLPNEIILLILDYLPDLSTLYEIARNVDERILGSPS